MTKFIISAAAHLVSAQAGQDKMTQDLKQRAWAKWEKSKSLPRKQKKLMRKDANLDYAFATQIQSHDFFNF